MPEARGIYLLRMDSKHRVFANGPMRRYLGLEKGEDSGVSCNIGFPRETDMPALVLINDNIADEISSRTREQDIDNFDVVSTEVISDPTKRIQDQFRPAEIKSGRIQFKKSERKKLNLPDGDNRVIVQGGGIRFLVWAASEFENRFPELYERFAQDDEDDD